MIFGEHLCIWYVHVIGSLNLIKFCRNGSNENIIFIKYYIFSMAKEMLKRTEILDLK
jgi:hypothetical protein